MIHERKKKGRKVRKVSSKNMMRKIVTYCVCTFITLFFIATSILMPKLYYMKMDKNSVEKVTTLKREDFSFASTLGIGEKTAEVMDDLNYEHKLKEIMSINKNDKNYKSYIANINEQITYAVSIGLIPDITSYDLEKGFLGAVLYQINSNSSMSDRIIHDEIQGRQQQNNSIWIVEFGNKNEYYFSFVLDGSLYTIYSVNLFCRETEEIWESERRAELNEIIGEHELVAYYKNKQHRRNKKFLEACKTYYHAGYVEYEEYGGISSQYYQEAGLFFDGKSITMEKGLLLRDMQTRKKYEIEDNIMIEKSKGVSIELRPIFWALHEKGEKESTIILQ